MAKTHIALAGNPNSGKTSTFNVLTGTNQFVGNWPGVTVERKEGIYKKDSEVIIDDLPGIYSLSPILQKKLLPVITYFRVLLMLSSTLSMGRI